jgi:hypothetical protein
MHGDLQIIPHESTLFSSGCKLTSLWGHTLSGQRKSQVKLRRAPAFGPARHWRFAGGAFTPPLTKGMLTPPWNPSVRFPALTGGASMDRGDSAFC